MISNVALFAFQNFIDYFKMHIKQYLMVFFNVILYWLKPIRQWAAPAAQTKPSANPSAKRRPASTDLFNGSTAPRMEPKISSPSSGQAGSAACCCNHQLPPTKPRTKMRMGGLNHAHFRQRASNYSAGPSVSAMLPMPSIDPLI